MSRTCEKCIHYDVCRYPLEYRAFPNTCWKYEEESPRGEWIPIKNKKGTVVALICSACDKNPKYALKSDFCPRCGADMRKSGEAE